MLLLIWKIIIEMIYSDDPEYFPPEEEEFDVKQLSNINMIVANCSNPGNYFHILRRQIALPFRSVNLAHD